MRDSYMAMTGALNASYALTDETAVRTLADREFEDYQEFIYERTGIHLGVTKKILVQGRLQKRLRELKVTSYGAYLALASTDSAEGIRMIDAITTNETHFFREAAQFEFIEQRVIPAWKSAATAGRKPRTFRVWSAGCSTGEEPYSLAMALLEALPKTEGRSIEIVATDISTRVLERAQAATWPIERAKEIPLRYLKAFMLRGSDDLAGLMRAGPELRNLVRTTRLNLNEPPYPLTGKFDLILCRNVMIYFDAPSRSRAVENMLNLLTNDGYFFVGHAESMNGVTDRLKSAAPMIYQLRAPGERSR